jgi:L-lactate dehydrogenase complex protein LldF
VLDICRERGAKSVTKGKSMIARRSPSTRLEEAGIAPVETDLGEYIIQLRGEPPSHIIAPAVHLNKDQVEADFRPSTPICRPTAAAHRAGDMLVGEARRCCARNSSPPTSASPAPTS